MFLDALQANAGMDARSVAERIMEWSDAHLGERWFGTGSRNGSFIPTLTVGNERYWPFALWTYGQMEIQFQYLRRRPPFDSAELREELRHRLNEIPGIVIPEDKLEGRPGFEIIRLSAEGGLESFLAIMGWVVDEIRRHWNSGHG